MRIQESIFEYRDSTNLMLDEVELLANNGQYALIP